MEGTLGGKTESAKWTPRREVLPGGFKQGNNSQMHPSGLYLGPWGGGGEGGRAGQGRGSSQF